MSKHLARAGFSEVDITPAVGTHIIGYLQDVVSSKVLDPLFARVAIFESGAEALALVQLDTLSVRWTQVQEIRQRIRQRYGFPSQALMVTASHNHAGPAVAKVGACPRDDGYIETLVQRVVSAFGQALECRQEAQVGFAQVNDFTLSCNRRVVMRDGTVVSQGHFGQPEALYVEGPIDPAVSVLAARGPAGKILGSIVHFTCHLAGHGPDRTALSAGHPGVLARNMKARGCPVTVYLNGCCGNVNNGFPDSRGRLDKEKLGEALANHATSLIAGMEWHKLEALHAASETVNLPFRSVTEEDVKGAARGAQRYAPPEVYERIMPGLLAKLRERGTQHAEVQALFMNDLACVGIPGEFFVEYGLRIREAAWPLRALVAGNANGMVGYVPTRQAFQRGGYETTFADSSRLAPEAGELLAEAAIRLLHAHETARV